MSTEKKLIVAEQICEFAIGWTIGGITNAVVKPKGAFDGVLTTVGSMAIAFVVGRTFGKEFAEACDNKLGTDLKDRFV